MMSYFWETKSISIWASHKRGVMLDQQGMRLKLFRNP